MRSMTLRAVSAGTCRFPLSCSRRSYNRFDRVAVFGLTEQKPPAGWSECCTDVRVVKRFLDAGHRLHSFNGSEGHTNRFTNVKKCPVIADGVIVDVIVTFLSEIAYGEGSGNSVRWANQGGEWPSQE